MNNYNLDCHYLYGCTYTPIQYFEKIYAPEIGLKNGTIFPELVSSYFPNQSIEFIEYLKNGDMCNE